MTTTFSRIVDADDPRLHAFYAGVYLDAFAAQREPLANWQRALRGELPYEIAIVLAGTDGGIVYERYRTAALLTYLVVAPHARRRGLGRALIDHALAALGDGVTVFAEADDPAKHPEPAARERVDRFVRWGARIVPVRYIQPALGPDLPPDDRLILLHWGAAPTSATVAGFVAEFAAALATARRSR